MLHKILSFPPVILNMMENVAHSPLQQICC